MYRVGSSEFAPPTPGAIERVQLERIIADVHATRCTWLSAYLRVIVTVVVFTWLRPGSISPTRLNEEYLRTNLAAEGAKQPVPSLVFANLS